jgi:hypothetical protein
MLTFTSYGSVGEYNGTLDLKPGKAEVKLYRGRTHCYTIYVEVKEQ